MKKLRVLVLVHDGLVPPLTMELPPDGSQPPWRMEYDVVAALGQLGHDVRPLGVGDDIGAIRRAIEEFDPHVCFNLLIEFHGAATYDQHVVSYLELLRHDYTGCNPRGLTLARDKGLSKEILTFHRVRVPRFQVFPHGRKVRPTGRLKLPAFVKSVNEEASLGIAQASIVRNERQLADRIEFIHSSVGTDALVEEYIDGRELYVAVVGNERLSTYPVRELLFANLPEGTAPIATRRVKWDVKYQKKLGVTADWAKNLPEGVADELARVSRRAYRSLRLSGYARMDFRMDAEGRIFLLEANPNADLTFGEDFAESAEAGGLPYERLIQRIIDLGMAYQADWKAIGPPAT